MIEISIVVHCDAPGCARSTTAFARGYCDIAPLGGYLEFHGVRFPRDVCTGQETGWSIDRGRALCPEHRAA